MIAVIIRIICTRKDISILVVSPYRPQVCNAHQTGSNSLLILVDPDIQIEQPSKFMTAKKPQVSFMCLNNCQNRHNTYQWHN